MEDLTKRKNREEEARGGEAGRGKSNSENLAYTGLSTT